MQMICSQKMSYQNAVMEIFDSAKRSIRDQAKAGNLFQFSGENNDGLLTVISYMGDPESCVKTLTEKLSSIRVVKISAIFVIETE